MSSASQAIFIVGASFCVACSDSWYGPTQKMVAPGQPWWPPVQACQSVASRTSAPAGKDEPERSSSAATSSSQSASCRWPRRSGPFSRQKKMRAGAA